MRPIFFDRAQSNTAHVEAVERLAVLLDSSLSVVVLLGLGHGDADHAQLTGRDAVGKLMQVEVARF